MIRKIKKLVLHPNLYFYDYFRKKLGFRKYFVTDKIRLLDADNHQKWQKLLFFHPYLYLYYKFNKRLRKPAYPILVDYRIENIDKNAIVVEGGGKRVVLTVELERQNIIHFADPEIVLKALHNKEPYLTHKIFKFKFAGSNNKVVIDARVIFGKSFKVILVGDNNNISFKPDCKCTGGSIEFKGSENSISIGSSNTICNNVLISVRGNRNTFVSNNDCIFMSNAKLIFSQDGNYAYIGPVCEIYPSTRISFQDSNALAYFRGNQSIKQSISLTMGSIFFHGGCTKNISIVRHSYNLAEGKNILIGSDTMFSHTILMRTTDGHLIYDKNSSKRTNTGKSIIIGDHVWLGHDSMIFKGAKIEDGCVVGTRSIVTKHIPPNCICAGSPAIVKRENIEWDRTMPHHFTKEELDDYETYKGPPPIKFTPIGFAKLMEIDAIDSEVSAKEKVMLIERIIKA